MSASASNIVLPKIRRRSTEVPIGAICILTAVLATTFAAFMIWAMTVGDFKAEMSQLLSLPWGMVVTLDVYIGLALFSAWMFYREEKSVVALLWTLALVIGGNIVTCAYVLRAAYSSKRSAMRFFAGRRLD
tara:strand:- start:466 stop:858 length:393 start_codon:yes stop_codon:yes gene_type:complete